MAYHLISFYGYIFVLFPVVIQKSPCFAIPLQFLEQVVRSTARKSRLMGTTCKFFQTPLHLTSCRTLFLRLLWLVLKLFHHQHPDQFRETLSESARLPLESFELIRPIRQKRTSARQSQ